MIVGYILFILELPSIFHFIIIKDQRNIKSLLKTTINEAKTW